MVVSAGRLALRHLLFKPSPSHTVMTRVVSLLALAVFAFSGCDSATPSATADVSLFPGGGELCNDSSDLYGPISVSAGSVSSFQVGIDPPCDITSVTWSVGYGATITGTAGSADTKVYVQAGSYDFGVLATFEYIDEFGFENIGVERTTVEVE